MNSLHLITRGSTLIQWERVVNFQEKNGEDVRRCFFLLLLPSSSPITTFRLIAIDYESWPRRQKYQGSANYRRAKSSPASWRKERGRRSKKEDEEEEEEKEWRNGSWSDNFSQTVSSTSVQSSPAENTITVPDPFQQSSSLCVPFESLLSLSRHPFIIIFPPTPVRVSSSLSLSLRHPFEVATLERQAPFSVDER